MFCSQCAHKLTPTDVYCPNCSKAVASFNFDPGQIPQVEYIGDNETETVVRPTPTKPTARPPSESPWWYVGGTAAGAIVILAGSVAFIAFAVLAPKLVKPDPAPVNLAADKPPDRPSVNLPPPDLSPTPLPEKPRQQLIDQRIPVPARMYRSFEFAANKATRITGGFVTYGGSNDIDAYIVDNANFELFVNGQGFRHVFSRPKAARSTVDVTVPAGRWHVVFSNAHALLTDKEVAVELYSQEQ